MTTVASASVWRVITSLAVAIGDAPRQGVFVYYWMTSLLIWIQRKSPADLLISATLGSIVLVNCSRSATSFGRSEVIEIWRESLTFFFFRNIVVINISVK
ncbi:hypothetical protein DdX_09666 [Ditylenchus destructor]|uniref:Uncharacterized protein n=1 Tax=Ditylenchus destructor TaxID=166010 RepID=A0AAD4QZR9_9BILA|nr:hypothetical protein DdX_09666 [Ditylenchus destructor]